MNRTAVTGLAWVASVVVAWMMGAYIGRDRPGRMRHTAPRDGEDQVVVETARREPRRTVGGESTAPAGKGVPRVASRRADPVVADGPFTIEGTSTVEDASARFMRYVALKLAQGPAGHRELFRTIAGFENDEAVRALMKGVNERDASRLAYPWVKFLMKRETQVVAMMETLYRTAVEEPAFYEGMDDDPLEIFTEGMAFLLPAVADPETIGRLRAHVEAILAMPKGTLPEALERNRSEFSRNLEMWAPPLTPEQLRERIADPSVSVSLRIALARRAPSRSLGEVDLVPLISEGIRRGSNDAFGLIRHARISGGQTIALDQAVLDAVVDGQARSWQVRDYIRSTGRSEWHEIQPLVDSGLAMGSKATDVFAEVLLRLRRKGRPHKQYVESVLQRFQLPEKLAERLRSGYGIQ